jgi:hypothetical protein
VQGGHKLQRQLAQQQHAFVSRVVQQSSSHARYACVAAATKATQHIYSSRSSSRLVVLQALAATASTQTFTSHRARYFCWIRRPAGGLTVPAKSAPGVSAHLLLSTAPPAPCHVLAYSLLKLCIIVKACRTYLTAHYQYNEVDSGLSVLNQYSTRAACCDALWGSLKVCRMPCHMPFHIPLCLQGFMDLFNYLLRQRIVFLSGYVNDKV